jgi:hypothetical protein
MLVILSLSLLFPDNTTNSPQSSIRITLLDIYHRRLYHMFVAALALGLCHDG